MFAARLLAAPVVWGCERASGVLCTLLRQVSDSQGHNYTFNICGLSHSRCNPVWKDTYQFGVAVQVCVPQLLPRLLASWMWCARQSLIASVWHGAVNTARARRVPSGVCWWVAAGKCSSTILVFRLFLWCAVLRPSPAVQHDQPGVL